MDFANYWFSSGAGGGGGYEIPNSLRFRGAQQLSRTFSSAGNRNAWTYSVWLKLGKPHDGTDQCIFSAFTGGNNDSTQMSISMPGSTSAYGNNTLSCGLYQQAPKYTEARWRDYSSWYHVVIVRDRAAATTTDGLRFYVNNQRVDADFYDHLLTAVTAVNNNITHGIGNFVNSGASRYFTGYMAEIHFLDGTVVTDGTNFGEYNDDGVWVPIEVTGVTYGTNGFYLDFSDPANIGADRSGNGNNWTATNFELTNTTSAAYDAMVDSPTDNYSTINRLTNISGLSGTISDVLDANLYMNSNGNTTLPMTISADAGVGNYYWEIFMITVQASSNFVFGVQPSDVNRADYTSWPATRNDSVVVNTGGGAGNNTYIYGNTSSTTPWTVSTGDVVGIQLDAVSGDLTFYKNGALQVTLSGAVDVTRPHYPAVSGYSGSDAVGMNFGQIPFQYQPTGTDPLSTAALPNVDVTNPSEHFQTILAEGPDSTVGVPAGLVYGPVASTSPITAIYGKEVQDANINNSYPVFQWASSQTINGYSDWYVPAVYELDTLYFNLKPTTDASIASDPRDTYNSNLYKVPQRTTDYGPGGANPPQTSAVAFQEGGDEAFLTANDGIAAYYTVSQHGQLFNPPNTNPSFICFVKFLNGDMWANGKQNSLLAWRLIRREVYTGNEPAIGAEYAGGYFGGLYSVNGNGVATHALIVAPNRYGTYGWVGGILNAAQTTFPNGLWWIKDRANNNQHQLVDSVRGGNTAWTTPEQVAQKPYVGPSGSSVAWCWSAPDTWSNTAGTNGATIDSAGRRNLDGGFSIAQYTGQRPTTIRFAHGLNEAPDFVITRYVSGANAGFVYHKDAGTNYGNWFNGTYGGASSSDYVAVTSQYIEHGNTSTCNETGTNGMIAYSWNAVPGYSAFGKYTGNSSTDGPFVYTGFRVGWLMIRGLYTSGAPSDYNWRILDVERDLYNGAWHMLWSNKTDFEAQNVDSNNIIDLLSNGFKIRTASVEVNNASGPDYIWAAFAENPFGAGNVSPSPAR